MKKAEEFARGALEALRRGDTNQAVSSAAHCVISASDALCARRLNARSKARNHEHALRMIEAMPIEGAREKAVQGAEVLALKHLAEYDDQDISRKEAEKAAKQAQRFLEWVGQAIK